MRAETLKGHLDGMLLASLEAGPRHGYAIMEALRAGSGGQLDLPTGTIYPALHRLQRARVLQTPRAPARGGRPPPLPPDPPRRPGPGPGTGRRRGIFPP